jgi:hypothetical protein
MSTQPELSAAGLFIWRSARLIDRFRFAYLFLGGTREAGVEPNHNLRMARVGHH